MSALKNRIILILGLLIVIAGHLLNFFARKYQGLYRSLQYRNLKLEESIFSSELKPFILLVIGLGILIVLGRFMLKSRHLLKEKGIALAGALLFGGQTLNSLSANDMGRYVLFLGYLITLIGFILALHETKEQENNEV